MEIPRSAVAMLAIWVCGVHGLSGEVPDAPLIEIKDLRSTIPADELPMPKRSHRPVTEATVLRFLVDHVLRRSPDGESVWELPRAVDHGLVAAGLRAKLGPWTLATVRHRVAVLSTRISQPCVHVSRLFCSFIDALNQLPINTVWSMLKNSEGFLFDTSIKAIPLLEFLRKHKNPVISIVKGNQLRQIAGPKLVPQAFIKQRYMTRIRFP
jgi:hypothetical protein